MPVCLYDTPSQQHEQQQQQASQSQLLHVLTSAEQRRESVINAIECLHSTNSMPCWYFDKKELRITSSIRDGITFETERRYRKEGARFIMSCGTQMGLGHNTIATGVVYFHRFYMFHSFRSFPRYVTASCCLFLAGKVEETPKKCRDVIKTARALLNDNYFYSFGDDPKEYFYYEQEVMTLERILLQTIKFDLQVEHPYTFLLKYAKCLKGDQQKLQKMVQMAWNFVNDSLSTTVCLQWEPEIIAVALIHLASKLSKFAVSDWTGRQPQHLRWWDMFVSDVTMEVLEDICHQVLDLYQNSHRDDPDCSNSPPQKPPSRADSPTPLNKQPQPQQQAPPHQPYNPLYKHSGSALVSSSAATTEVGNIQAIKSLANVAPPHHQQPLHHRHVSNAPHMALPAASANYYGSEGSHHLYAQAPPLPGIPLPPPPSHIVYTEAPPPPPYPANAVSNNVAAAASVMPRSVPQPPLPPLPPSSGWTNSAPPYVHIPPMPMPPVPSALGLPGNGRVPGLPPPTGGNNAYYHHHHQTHASSSSSSSYHHHHHRSQRY